LTLNSVKQCWFTQFTRFENNHSNLPGSDNFYKYGTRAPRGSRNETRVGPIRLIFCARLAIPREVWRALQPRKISVSQPLGELATIRKCFWYVTLFRFTVVRWSKRISVFKLKATRGNYNNTETRCIVFEQKS